MTGALFLQLLLNGLAIGMTYVLVASGLILLLGVVKIFNFAHGEFYMLGAYITFGCVEFLKWNFFLAIAAGVVAVGLCSLLCYRLIFHHIRGDILLCTAASIGLSMLIQRSALLGFGSQERGLHSPFGGAWGVAGVRLPTERVVVILLCLTVMFALYLLLMRTKLGKAMRAVKLDKEVAALRGSTRGAFICSPLPPVAPWQASPAVSSPRYSPLRPTWGMHSCSTASWRSSRGGSRAWWAR